jgi:hypothetical protein
LKLENTTHETLQGYFLWYSRKPTYTLTYVIIEDELVTDAYPSEDLFNGTIMKVTSKFIEKKTNEDISVYDGNAFGGNNEEEEQGDKPSEEKVMVNAVVDAGELQETFFNDKKEYMSLIKKYMKRLLDEVKKNNPNRVSDFQKGAQDFVKSVLANFKDYQL